MKRRLTPLLVLLALFTVTARPVQADIFHELLMLPERNSTVDEFFGSDVSLDNDTVVISSHYYDTSFMKNCLSPVLIYAFTRFYVFTRSGGTTWTEQARLTHDDKYSFGSNLSLDGDTVVITSTVLIPSFDDQDEDSGSAYVFVRAADGSWSQQAKLMPADRNDERWFGKSVSLDGDTVVISTYRSNCRDGCGSAYVFVRTADGTWSEQATLMPADGSSRGRSVKVKSVRSISLDGNTVIIGMLDLAYVFVRAADGAWSEQATLKPDDWAVKTKFGRSVSLDDDTVVISSRRWIGSYSYGVAYVFVRSGTTWSQQARLMPAAGAVGNEFGRNVSLDGDTVIITSPTRGAKGEKPGAAYVFTRSGTTWTEQAKLTAPDVAKPSGH